MGAGRGHWGFRIFGPGWCKTAAKLILEPIWEADLEPNAYGYRPRRSAQDAVEKVQELLEAGYTDVVDADLSKYFDSIPQDKLLACVRMRVVDRSVLKLIRMWLQSPVVEPDSKGKPGTWTRPVKGPRKGV